MPPPLKVWIVLRCTDVAVPATSVADLEALALQIEIRIVPLILQLMDGIIEVQRVLVEVDPS